MDVEPERLLEERRRDQQPVGADDDHVGRPWWQLGPLRLVHRDPEPLRRLLRGRRRQAAAAAAGRVGPRQQVGDLVLGREPRQDVGAERCRRGDGEAH